MYLVILLAMSVTAVTGQKDSPISNCDVKGTPLKEGSPYTLFKCDLNWEGARTKCNAEGKVLMRATDDVVKSLKDVKETFWTAGTNRYKNDYTQWEWSDYGTNATKEAGGLKSRRSCLVFDNGKLIEKNCFTVYMNFVCVGDVAPKQVGPRKNLAFTSLANMINEGNEEGCPWRAVDEDTGSNFDKNTCAVTKDSENPWFVLAFGTKTTFSEVAITGRSKTEDTEMLYAGLKDFKLAVADTFDWVNFEPSEWTECASFDGEFQPGQRVSFRCEVDGEAAEAKYLAIYVDGRSASLQICNLEVYE